MSNLSEAFRLIDNLIRTGTVFAVDLTVRPACVRIENGDWRSGWLQWIELRAGSTKTWNPPTTGENVVAFCPGGDTSAGLVLAGLNTDAMPAPSSSGSEHVTVYPDGARFAYDHGKSALTVTGVKTLNASVSESALMVCPDITLDGNVTVTGLLSYQAGMSGRDGKGNRTVITGNLIHRDGELSSNGVVLETHRHKANGEYAVTDGPLK